MERLRQTRGNNSRRKPSRLKRLIFHNLARAAPDGPETIKQDKERNYENNDDDLHLVTNASARRDIIGIYEFIGISDLLFPPILRQRQMVDRDKSEENLPGKCARAPQLRR